MMDELGRIRQSAINPRPDSARFPPMAEIAIQGPTECGPIPTQGPVCRFENQTHEAVAVGSHLVVDSRFDEHRCRSWNRVALRARYPTAPDALPHLPRLCQSQGRIATRFQSGRHRRSRFRQFRGRSRQARKERTSPTSSFHRSKRTDAAQRRALDRGPVGSLAGAGLLRGPCGRRIGLIGR